MKFRFTIKELDELSDTQMLRALVAERKNDLNPYTPLAKRLAELYSKLDKQVQAEQTK